MVIKINGYGDKNGLTFLELHENGVESGVLKDEVEGILVVAANGLEWRVVVRVDEGEVFNEQH